MSETDPTLAEALLRQDPGRAQDPRNRDRGPSRAWWRPTTADWQELIIGTIAVWGLWTAMIVAIVAVGFLHRGQGPPTQTAGVVPPPVPLAPGPQMQISGIGTFLLMLLGFLCLPAVVMLPWWLIFPGPRTRPAWARSAPASASIESQLKAAGPGGPGDHLRPVRGVQRRTLGWRTIPATEPAPSTGSGAEPPPTKDNRTDGALPCRSRLLPAIFMKTSAAQTSHRNPVSGVVNRRDRRRARRPRLTLTCAARIWTAFWICSFTASRLKLAPFCIGGNSMAVWASFADLLLDVDEPPELVT